MVNGNNRNGGRVGIASVPMDKRNPCQTTSFGNGELIKQALDRVFNTSF